MNEVVDPSFDTTGYAGYGSLTKNRKSEVVAFENPTAYTRSIRATALVFEDPLSQALYERIRRLAPSTANALIIGETGTGKELVARQLHHLSLRSKGPFVAVNCAALPEQLVESELFGHEKGAFTGAVIQKKGWFEVANGGTLFLDEIGDLPPATQVKLLRVLQERELSRVGGRVSIPIDIRLIAATNVNLEEAVRTGRFREDLYYRLNVARLQLPPLRKRVGDILPLARHFVGVYLEHLHLDEAEFTESAKRALLTYPWPGNIRELENVVHHAMLVMRDGRIDASDLHLARLSVDDSTSSSPSDISNANSALEQALLTIFDGNGKNLYADIEARVVRCAFEYCQNNQLQTARLLGISRNILRHRLKLYGML
jgi:sigma-54 dependent transcriptional regulator